MMSASEDVRMQPEDEPNLDKMTPLVQPDQVQTLLRSNGF